MRTFNILATSLIFFASLHVYGQFTGPSPSSSSRASGSLNGLYAGITAGYNKANLGLNNTINGFPSGPIDKINAVNIAAHLGYEMSLPIFYLAAEASLGYKFGSASKQYDSNVKIVSRTGLGGDLSLKVGGTLGKSGAAYLIAVLAGDTFTFSPDANSTQWQQVLKRPTFAFGFGPGIGARYKITSKFSASLEYKYLFFHHTVVKDIQGDVSIKPRTHVINLLVSYHF